MDTRLQYVALVKELAKAQGLEHPRALVRGINAAHDATEPKVTAALLGVVKRARTRFRRKVSVNSLTEMLSTIHKDESDDVKERLRIILEAAFDGAAADLVDSESDLIDSLARQFATVHDVDLNFKVINEKAVDYLENHAENFFTTLADDQAEGLLAEVAEQLKSESGYGIREIAASIRDAFLNDALYYDTDIGTRNLSVTQWSILTGRTETARAASASQRATLESLNLKTWEWAAQSSCCDDCDSNDGEIVAIGDDFPSGDSQPPVHPNCRCVVLPVQSELTSLNSNDDSSQDDDAQDAA